MIFVVRTGAARTGDGSLARTGDGSLARTGDGSLCELPSGWSSRPDVSWPAQRTVPCVRPCLTSTIVPHFLQNFASFGSCSPHFRQYISSPPMCACVVRHSEYDLSVYLQNIVVKCDRQLHRRQGLCSRSCPIVVSGPCPGRTRQRCRHSYGRRCASAYESAWTFFRSFLHRCSQLLFDFSIDCGR